MPGASAVTPFVVLSCRTKKHKEDAPELADLYFSYGKALLENAISQASVLGKEPEPGPQGEEEKRRMPLIL